MYAFGLAQPAAMIICNNKKRWHQLQFTTKSKRKNWQAMQACHLLRSLILASVFRWPAALLRSLPLLKSHLYPIPPVHLFFPVVDNSLRSGILDH